MSEQKFNNISIPIDNIELFPSFRTSLKSRIFKVDDLLRRVNEKAYEPVMLAIGPYHHGKENLIMMKEHKSRYLQELLNRRNEPSGEIFLRKLRAKLKTLEERVRRCYAEDIKPNQDELVEMMLLDGCFIIELFRKFNMKELVIEDDPIFKMDRMIYILQRDLLLFENQLPFFILVELFDMTKLPDDEMDIVHMALSFISLPYSCLRTDLSSDNVDHLLDLVHQSLTPPLDMVSYENDPYYLRYKGQFIGCTIKLQREGVLFEKAGDNVSLFNIRFEDGVMKIPPLMVDVQTECLFRNLIAHEQYHQNLHEKYVTDYATLMDCLVDTEKDAEQLCNYKVLENRLASDEAMSDMFNKLCSSVTINPKSFCYSGIFKKVNDYCTSPSGKRAWRSYKGELWYHLRNPMTLLNLQISIMTLLFAVIQIIVPLCIKK